MNKLRLMATATVELNGSPDAVAALLAQLAQFGTVQIQVAPEHLPALVNPLDLPLGRRPKGRALDVLRRDLARQPSTQIATELNIEVSTVRSIRRRLRELLGPIPPAQRPVWLAGWFTLHGHRDSDENN